MPGSMEETQDKDNEQNEYFGFTYFLWIYNKLSEKI